MDHSLEGLELGEEHPGEPMRAVPPDAWAGHLAEAFWLVKVTRSAPPPRLPARTARARSTRIRRITPAATLRKCVLPPLGGTSTAKSAQATGGLGR